MIPLLNDSWKELNEIRNYLKETVIQPFANQKAEWKKLIDKDKGKEDIAQKNVLDPNQQNDFDFFMHSEIGPVKSEKSTDGLEIGAKLMPEFFAVCYDEYKEFEERLK
ncbi:uncharacterized protein GO595_008567 [Histomonas meleagridis]|uniref:uncharacterized protein n=1 Tax=Histomonas meleagridis TaxID=135588 RepID=UPI00355937A8|nr:hypothetical protein GO595_008567 [Histomonas meleagridis]